MIQIAQDSRDSCYPCSLRLRCVGVKCVNHAADQTTQDKIPQPAPYSHAPKPWQRVLEVTALLTRKKCSCDAK